MERESNSMQALCRSGCGFYGNPSTDGLCSLCYKEALKKKQQPPGPSPSATSTQSTAPAYSTSTSNSVTTAFSASNAKYMDTAIPTIPVVSAQTSAEKKDLNDDNVTGVPSNATTDASVTDGNDDVANNSNSDDNDSKTKKRNRCALCRKKVGLTGFECRCGGLYCGIHRYSDKHNCTFDYRQLGAQEIRRNNPVVIGEKIQKI